MQVREDSAARTGARSGRAARIGASFGVFAAPLAASHAARAQELPDSVFVAQDAFERPYLGDVFTGHNHPEQQALGIPLGTFLLRPSIDLSAIANSNVRARATGGDAAAGVVAAPTVAIASRNPRYRLNAYVTGTATRYAERSTENVEQLFGGVSYARELDALNRASLQVEGGRYIEDRASAFTPFDARTPIRFERYHVRLEGVSTPGRLVFSPSIEVDRLAYHDNRLASDPTQVLVQRVRSLTRTGAGLLAGYALNGDTAVYAGVETNFRNYDIDRLRGRDSHGYAAFVGLRIRPTNLIQVDAAIGRLHQYYYPQFTDPKGLYAQLAVTWVPTALTDIKFDLRRDVSETGAIQNGGAIRTRARLRLTHELYRDLSISMGAETTGYRLPDVQRTDRRSYLTGEARYFANRELELFARAQQLFSRSGGVPTLAPDFDRTIVSVGARLKR